MTDARPDAWTIVVVRSGGFAGLTREWRVHGAEHPDVDWPRLIEACPWNAVAPPDHSRDRFVWRIEASARSQRCRASLPDALLRGPWRELVDEVTTLGAAPPAGR